MCQVNRHCVEASGGCPCASRFGRCGQVTRNCSSTCRFIVASQKRSSKLPRSGGPPAIIHLPRGRPGGAIGLPRGVSSAGGQSVQSAMHSQSLRGRGFHCRPTHRRRQPKPAGGTCSSRGAANVLARKPCSEPRPHSCTACLAGSLWCDDLDREWKTSVGCPPEASIDARAWGVPHLFPATLGMQSILGSGGTKHPCLTSLKGS